MTQFLIDNAWATWAIKLGGAAAAVLVLGWFAGRGVPRQQDGWVHARYPVGAKLLIVAGAIFLTVAIAYNGRGLFAAEWWVPPVILVFTLGTYWLVHEMFAAEIRWNGTGLQVFRPPFAPRAIAFADIVSVQHHATIEVVALRARDGGSVWLPYGLRIGMPDLFARLSQARAAPED